MTEAGQREEGGVRHLGYRSCINTYSDLAVARVLVIVGKTSDKPKASMRAAIKA